MCETGIAIAPFNPPSRKGLHPCQTLAGQPLAGILEIAINPKHLQELKLNNSNTNAIAVYIRRRVR